jgi:hypothetical protein
VSPDTEDIETGDREINCKCDCNCRCKYDELPVSIRILLFNLLFWLIGQATYWLLVFNIGDNDDKFIDIMKIPIFHIFMLICGFISFGIGGFCIIALSKCCKFCRLNPLILILHLILNILPSRHLFCLCVVIA